MTGDTNQVEPADCPTICLLCEQHFQRRAETTAQAWEILKWASYEGILHRIPEPELRAALDTHCLQTIRDTTGGGTIRNHAYSHPKLEEDVFAADIASGRYLDSDGHRERQAPEWHWSDAYFCGVDQLIETISARRSPRPPDSTAPQDP